MNYDVIVIGAGPAGLTTALYVARSGKSVLVLEKNAFGGQIATSPRVENFPSVISTSGAELADKMFEQASSHGVEFDMGDASVEKCDGGFAVTTEYASHFAKAVVLATGVTHKKLNVQGEENFAGSGVCYCAVCDGPFYEGKEVVVVGDGNSAVQYALYLADICSKVTILTLFDKFFCDKEIEDRLKNNGKIEWVKNVSVTEILGKDAVNGIAYKDGDGAITYLDTQAVFVAIGQKPECQKFSKLVALDERGFVVGGEDCKTSTDGVFVAGDCRTKSVRQCATAVSDGAVAGFSASQYVDKIK